jgi:hypothetical protein
VWARTRQVEDQQTADDLIVMVALLHKLLATPEGKRVLKKSFKGKTYDVGKLFGLNSPEFDIGMLLVNGEITRQVALIQLQKQLAEGRDMHPDRKTLKTILDDIEEHCVTFYREAEVLTGLGGMDIPDAEALLAKILGFKRDR